MTPRRPTAAKRCNVSSGASILRSPSKTKRKQTGPCVTVPPRTSSRRRRRPSLSSTCSRGSSPRSTAEKQPTLARSNPLGSSPTMSHASTEGSVAESKKSRAPHAGVRGSSRKEQPPSGIGSLLQQDGAGRMRRFIMSSRSRIMRIPAQPLPGPARAVEATEPAIGCGVRAVGHDRLPGHGAGESVSPATSQVGSNDPARFDARTNIEWPHKRQGCRGTTHPEGTRYQDLGVNTCVASQNQLAFFRRACLNGISTCRYRRR
jgi:hypothetical protein